MSILCNSNDFLRSGVRRFECNYLFQWLRSGNAKLLRRFDQHVGFLANFLKAGAELLGPVSDPGVDPVFNPYRTDPRMKRLLKQLGLR